VDRYYKKIVYVKPALISCKFTLHTLIHSKMLDFCLKPGKIDSLKMLDLRKKSAINPDNL
jgi:hypothetical protein